MRNNTTNLVICSAGIFVSYFVYGILQEKVTKTRYGKTREKFDFYFTMLFIQCVINAAFARAAAYLTQSPRKSVPALYMACCSFSYICAMLASNYSLKFVTYPTQVIGKSCKPIPVMILSVLWAKQRYPLRKYLFVLIIIIGVVLFMYNPNKNTSDGSHHWGTGEILLLTSLALDGVTGGIQQDLVKRHNIGPYQTMGQMNAWALLLLGSCLVITGEGRAFLPFLEHHPEVLYNIILFGIASAIGQFFIFTMVTSFSPLMCSIVTTTRKFFTVLFSIIFFSHVITLQQWCGSILVFTGLFCDQLWGKTSSHAKKST